MSFLCFTTNGILVLAFLFVNSVHVFYMYTHKLKNSKGTTVGTFSNSFAWLLHALSLSIHSYIIMRSCLYTEPNAWEFNVQLSFIYLYMTYDFVSYS